MVIQLAELRYLQLVQFGEVLFEGAHQLDYLTLFAHALGNFTHVFQQGVFEHGFDNRVDHRLRLVLLLQVALEN